MTDKPFFDIGAIEERVQRNLGRAMFAARWIMAPLYVGLLVALLLVVIKFLDVLIEGVPGFFALNGNDAVFLILRLIDLSLIANLIVIVIFAGWENFVGRLLAKQGDTPPELLGGLDFSAIKLRLIGSIAAISAILILETFVHIDQITAVRAGLQLGIMLGIGVLGVLLALADKLSTGPDGRR
jgi:uncharacterized protein (TIGR00645 family)